MDDFEKRKSFLVNKGYFTVNKLIEKLQELKDDGHGEDLIGSDCEHYSVCEYDSYLHYVIVE